jgi:hypothetical protein
MKKRRAMEGQATIPAAAPAAAEGRRRAGSLPLCQIQNPMDLIVIKLLTSSFALNL